MRDMKKIALTTIIIFTLLASLGAGLQTVEVVMANPIPNTYTSLTIDAPQNAIYTSNKITVNFKAHGIVGIGDPASVRYLNYSYILDENKPVIIENITKISDFVIDKNIFFYQYNLTGSITLPNLSEGKHNLTIQLIYYSEILHPENSTLAKTDTQFTVNLPQDPPTITPTTTPTRSPTPSPTPTNSPTQQPTLEPTLTPWLEGGHGGLDLTRLIIASLLTLAVIVGLLFYFKKRRR